MEQEEEFVTYKKNVIYNLGARRTISDTDGVMLTNEFPTIRVEKKHLRDFRMANKYALTNGLLKEVPTDEYEFSDHNAVSDDEATELLKNYAKLKSVLQQIDSLPIVQKIYNLALEQEKSPKVKSLVKARLDELTPEDLTFVSKDDMRGSSDG